MAVTHDQVQAVLTGRGLVGVPLVDYELTDNSDGQGGRISRWNTPTLGAIPTPAELAAITPAQLAAVGSARLDSQATRDVDALLLKAIVQGLWETISAPLLTKVQLRTRILSLYRGSL